MGINVESEYRTNLEFQINPKYNQLIRSDTGGFADNELSKGNPERD